jgi:hypothetical protein
VAQTRLLAALQERLQSESAARASLEESLRRERRRNEELQRLLAERDRVLASRVRSIATPRDVPRA